MIKNIFLAFLLFFSIQSFGQVSYPGQVFTKNNDTINVRININASEFNVNKLVYVQDKLTVVENGAIKDYFPGDIKGFRIRLQKRTVDFDDIDGQIFAERLYVGKVLLYKTLRKVSTNNLFRFYSLKKPNQDKWQSMIAFGLSRLITKKDMLPVFEDCKVIHDKIENDEIKIKDEEILINFIKEYEQTCFPN